jgi:hypothetical protein
MSPFVEKALACLLDIPFPQYFLQSEPLIFLLIPSYHLQVPFIRFQDSFLTFYQCSTGTCPSGWGARPPRFPRTQDGGAPGETFPHIPLLGKLRETQGGAFPQCGGHVSPKWAFGHPPSKRGASGCTIFYYICFIYDL